MTQQHITAPGRDAIAELYGPDVANLFERAAGLYTEWNSRINVISRKDMDNIASHHFLHSLAIDRYMRFEPGSSVLDVGTGGGFPGIPLSIIRPDVSFTLCDSIAKKIRVATAVAEALALPNVTTVNARAESLDGTYDYIVSRAVTSLVNFYPWVRGRYRRGILCLKGGDVASEIAALTDRYRLDPAAIHVWPISSVYEDEYFREKFVIHIEKT